MKGYPFHDGPLWARNQWYLAAWSSEIADAPLSRRILNQDILLLRSRGGEVSALSGVCPHRWMRLGPANVTSELISCPYHGAQFDYRGRCVELAMQAHIPPGLSLRRYPVIEAGPCVWIWPGDADQADAALLPDGASFGLGGTGWRVDVTPPIQLRARAQILLENLFDERHINVVHASSLAGCDNDLFRESEAVDRPDRFSVTRRTAPTATDATMKAIFPQVGSHSCSDLSIELLGVGLVNNLGSVTYATDASGTDARPVGRMNFIHGVTPETETTTHYFVAQTRDFQVEDSGLSASFEARNVAIIAEDIAILEAIEPMLDAYAHARQEISLATDALAMRIRRRMQRIIARETSDAPVGVAQD